MVLKKCDVSGSDHVYKLSIMSPKLDHRNDITPVNTL